MQAHGHLMPEQQCDVLGKEKHALFKEGKFTQQMIRTLLKTALTRVNRIDERAARRAPATGSKMAAAMGAAYEAAKAGGKHDGMLRVYRELPGHLIVKAIRSLAARAAEHRAWIAKPEMKLGPGVAAVEVERLVREKWPKEVQGFEEEIDVLEGILRERARR